MTCVQLVSYAFAFFGFSDTTLFMHSHFLPWLFTIFEANGVNVRERRPPILHVHGAREINDKLRTCVCEQAIVSGAPPPLLFCIVPAHLKPGVRDDIVHDVVNSGGNILIVTGIFVENNEWTTDEPYWAGVTQLVYQILTRKNQPERDLIDLEPDLIDLHSALIPIERDLIDLGPDLIEL